MVAIATAPANGDGPQAPAVAPRRASASTQVKKKTDVSTASNPASVPYTTRDRGVHAALGSHGTASSGDAE